VTEPILGSLNPLKGDRVLHQIELIDSSILMFLMPNVLPDDFFIPTHRRDEVAACPEVLSHKASLSLSLPTRNVNRAFPLDEPNYLG